MIENCIFMYLFNIFLYFLGTQNVSNMEGIFVTKSESGFLEWLYEYNDLGGTSLHHSP